MKTPTFGHVIQETAYLIADYPYGRTLRCQRRVWLESDPKHQAVAIDASPQDVVTQAYFAPVASRLQFITGDVTEPATWSKLPADFDYVLHGAAITPHAFTEIRT